MTRTPLRTHSTLQFKTLDEGPARFVVLCGTTVGRSFVLDGDATIGRGEDAQLVIEDGSISRSHARVRRLANGYWLEDLGSRNGTIHNGVPLAQQAVPLSFGDRVQVGLNVILLFTHYDAVEDQLLRQQRLETLGRIAAGVAHDFNNMLGVVLATLEYLSDSPGHLRLDDEDVRDCLTEARAATARAAELTPRMLGHVRGHDGQHRPLCLGELANDVLGVVRRTFDRKTNVEGKVEGSLPICGDKAELFQIVMNLCLNARDAMPDGGTLVLEARAATPEDLAATSLTPAPFALLTVRDTGTGMDAETAARIFEPFFSTKSNGAGFGLGLATARQMVAVHGGQIFVESEIGVGTAFHVFLPLRSKSGGAIETKGKKLARIRDRGRFTVLLVDDDAMCRKAYSRGLRRAGFEVLEAEDGPTALRRFRTASSTPHVVVLDIDMPELSGDETFRMLRLLEPGVAAVVLSGHAADPRIDAVLRAGAMVHLRKPCPFDTLVEAIEEACLQSDEFEMSTDF